MDVCHWLVFQNLFIYRVQMKEFQDQKNKKANYYGPDQIWYQDQVTLWALVWYPDS